MLSGPRGFFIILWIVTCAVFSGAFFVDKGWVAYGACVGASAACLVLLLILYRPESKLKKAIHTLIQGGSSDDVLCHLGKDELSRAICDLAAVVAGDRERRAMLEEVLNGVGNPVFVTDKDGTIVIATKSLLLMLGKPANKVLGESVGKALYGRSGSSVAEEVLKSRKDVHGERELTFWDGRVVPVTLTVNVFHDTHGDVGGVVASFVDLSGQKAQTKELEEQQARINEAGKRLSSLAEHVASATELLSAAADDQAQGAQKQRNQTSMVATAMEEMTSTVLEVAQNATVTSEAADNASASAEEGVGMVNSAVSAINEVAESAEQLSREVGELDSQAEEIGRIISVINDIADQTNLLALNAAIEAARAGDAGRGFAVVADEVRKLAEKTVTATKEVEEAIGMIQTRSRHALESMQLTETRVVESTDLSNQAGQSLQQIMENISDMVGRVSQIATAAGQQSSAAEEINQNVDEIAMIATEADEAAGQAASATRDLAGLAQELLNVSKEFREGGGETQLRASEGEMKGILPKLTQEFIKKQYGDELFEGMQDEMGHPVFLSTDSYPDQVLMQMAEYVAEQASVSLRDFFLDLGRFTVVKFHEMYPRHFKNESLKTFYLRMNDVHAQLTKDAPGIKPPTFTYEDKGDDLFMNYRSNRGLFDYFEGILLGAADFKGERVTVQVKPFDETTARAEIVFHGKK